MSDCTCLTLPNITFLTADCPVHNLRKCVICAKAIIQKKSESPGRFRKRETCGDKTCFMELRAKKAIGRVKLKPCPYCGELITRRQYPSRLESKWNYERRVTCGARKCFAAHMKVVQDATWAKRRRPPPTPPDCPYCGEKVKPRPRYDGKPGSIYTKTCCKPECLRAARMAGAIKPKPKRSQQIPKTILTPPLKRFLERYGTIPYEAVKVHGAEAFDYWQQCLER